MQLIDIMAAAGVALGLLGSVLGILSTWATMTRDRPRLKVRPVWLACRTVTGRSGVFRFTGRRGDTVEDFPDGKFGIEVVNAGYVAVWLREVGVCPLRTTLVQRFRTFPEPAGRGSIYKDTDGNIVLPHQLLPGARCVIAGTESTHRTKAFQRARTVYAMTEADQLTLGRGQVLVAVRSKAIRDAVASP